MTKARQFILVYQKGIFYRAGCWKLWVMPNQLPFARVGFLVTKKNASKLVGINRIKRLLKEVYRLNKRKVKGGVDLIIGGQGVLRNDLTLKSTEANLLPLFKKAGILC